MKMITTAIITLAATAAFATGHAAATKDAKHADKAAAVKVDCTKAENKAHKDCAAPAKH